MESPNMQPENKKDMSFLKKAGGVIGAIAGMAGGTEAKNVPLPLTSSTSIEAPLETVLKPLPENTVDFSVGLEHKGGESAFFSLDTSNTRIFFENTDQKVRYLLVPIFVEEDKGVTWEEIQQTFLKAGYQLVDAQTTYQLFGMNKDKGIVPTQASVVSLELFSKSATDYKAEPVGGLKADVQMLDRKSGNILRAGSSLPGGSYLVSVSEKIKEDDLVKK